MAEVKVKRLLKITTLILVSGAILAATFYIGSLWGEYQAKYQQEAGQYNFHGKGRGVSAKRQVAVYLSQGGVHHSHVYEQ